MWSLSNTTPFPARVSAFRDQAGASFWGLWLKAGFEMRRDRPALFLAAQPPLVEDPVYAGPALEIDTDLAQPRPKVDLILRGTVTSNADGSVRPLRVQLGDFNVTHDLHPAWRRNWRKAWVPDPDAAPVTCSLDARSAYGGADDPLNPAGQGAGEGDAPPPLLAHGDPKARTPVHFGPVAPTAPPRAALGGTYDKAWQAERAPLLPADLQPAFWQSAPPDRQLARPIPADAPLVLTGFGAVDGRYPVPHLDLHCATRIAGTWHQAEAVLQSVVLDLDSGCIALTYLACWPIARASDDVKISATTVKLERWDMFRVRPEDIGRFALSAHQREAS